MGSTFTTQVKDSVMAFQKAYRLSRTYVFNTECWRRLDGAKTIKPRYTSPSTHIEVDKGRQILMIVKGGDVWGIICVSTGATGNTPEGTFHIQQKHPFTTSGYGGILMRTMGFIGDFAIHGYSAGAAVSGQPRLRARAHLGLLLDLRPVLGRRDGVHLPLTRGRAAGRRRRRAARPLFAYGAGAPQTPSAATAGGRAPWSRAAGRRGRRRAWSRPRPGRG